jgi:recombination protein RecA
VSTYKTILKGASKKHGDGIVSLGVSYHNAERIPTGVFPFDLASGGGFPKGRVSVIFGPESSLKTTLALLCAAQEQRLEPDKTVAFVDAENAMDPEWAGKLGVDVGKLGYIQPDYAEQTIDIVEELLYANDVGLVILDSIAALTSSMELGQSADQNPMGRSGLNAGKLYRRATTALSKVRKENRHPALICINQIRYKLGVMHGDPETQPGGKAFNFASSMTVRLYGKDVQEKKYHAALPYAKEVNGVIRKYKVPILAKNFVFKMPVMNLLHMGQKMGYADPWNTMKHYLQELGHLEKVGQKWRVFEDEYATLKELRQILRKDEAFCHEVQKVIVADLIERQNSDAGEFTEIEDES